MTSERDWRGLLFVAPFLLLYSLILIFPLLRGMWLSLNQVDLFGNGQFVGLGNYARLLDDPVFGTSLVNTFEVTLMIVPPLTIIALALAMALNRASRSAAIFRGIFFSSAVLSVTIVTLIWRFMLAPDAGFLGFVAKAFGAVPLAFLSDEHLVLPALAITTIWWSVGFPMPRSTTPGDGRPSPESPCPRFAARSSSSSCCRRRRSCSSSASRNC